MIQRGVRDDLSKKIEREILINTLWGGFFNIDVYRMNTDNYSINIDGKIRFAADYATSKVIGIGLNKIYRTEVFHIESYQKSLIYECNTEILEAIAKVKKEVTAEFPHIRAMAFVCEKDLSFSLNI